MTAFYFLICQARHVAGLDKLFMVEAVACLPYSTLGEVFDRAEEPTKGLRCLSRNPRTGRSTGIIFILSGKALRRHVLSESDTCAARQCR